MRIDRLLPALLVLPNLAGVSFAGPTRQAVLAAIPDDVATALIAPNLEKLVEGVAGLGRALEVDDLAKITAQELIEKGIEHMDGLDSTGCFVLGFAADATDKAYFLCPLKDLDAWKKANAATSAEGNLAELFQLKRHGDDTYALVQGDVLMLTSDPHSLLDAKKAKGRFAELLAPRGELLDKHQLIVAVDVPRWDASLRESLSELEGLMRMGAAGASDTNAAEVNTAVARWMTGRIRELVANSKSLVVGLHFDGEGVRLKEIWSFKADSDVARYLAKVKKTEGSPLRGLPPAAFAMAFGYEWEMPPGTPSLAEDMSKIVIETTKGADKEKLEAIVRKSTELHKQFSGLGGALTAASDAGLVFSLLYHAQSGRASAKAMAELGESSMAMMNAFSMGVDIDAKHSTDKIDDTDVDVFSMKFNSKDPAMTMGLGLVYGQSPQAVLGGRADGVAMTFGPEAATRERMAAMLKAKSEAFVEQTPVAAALKQISPQPQVVLLVDILEFARTAIKIAQKASPAVPAIKLPDEPTPLVVAGLYLEPESIRAEAMIPAAPIKTILKVMDSDAPGDAPKE